MYYRYKVKKKKNNFLKYLIVIVFIVSIGYLGYKYRSNLLFWEYTITKIENKISDAISISDNDERRIALNGVKEDVERYKMENPLSPVAYFLAGNFYFSIGETYLSGKFSELLINDTLKSVIKRKIPQFKKAIIHIKKGIVLLNENKIPNKALLALGKSLYYSSYSDNADILSLFEKMEPEFGAKNIEDIRFLSLLNIINGRIETGMSLLSKVSVSDSKLYDKLYLAAIERIANRYTDAIEIYKSLLNKTDDTTILILIHNNLGKIYFKQSLYKESLKEFEMALSFNEDDNRLKIWIGKNYFALGEKDKAKAIWSEVLLSDRTNKEVEKLLKII